MLSSRPAMSMAAIANAAGYRALSSLTRALGIVARPAATGDDRGGSFEDEIDVGRAGVIVRAMGIAPCEVPWL